ncbi:hypothetical protein [Lactococcus lactis]|nr:hypothetical protein [Lactococcus lactis]
MSELEKATYDRGFYNGIREARQIFAKHLNASTSTDEIKWDNVSKTEILSEIDNFMMKNESYPQPLLTIPKNIAEMIDKEIMADAVTKFAMFHEGFERLWLSDELEMYCADKENYALASAYLAGKALRVDLVKVVEG